MKKTITVWNQSTPEEIAEGAPEMVLVSENEVDIEIPDREVPLWKIKAILKLNGLYTTINEAIEGLSEPTKTMAQMSWEYGTVINQISPTVNLIQTVANLTDEQVHEIFNQAELIHI